MDKLNGIKMSSSLKDRIKNDYKKEKKKPIYKVRKAMNYEIEIDTRIIAAMLIVSLTVPVVDSIVKFNDLTSESYYVKSNFDGGNIKDAEGEKIKD